MTISAQSHTTLLSAQVQQQLKTALCQMQAASTLSPSHHATPKAADKVEQDRIVADNFNRLIAMTRQYGFPNNAYLGADLLTTDCAIGIDVATGTLLNQIALTQPYLLFDPVTVALFAAEIEKGNLKRALLHNALSAYATAPTQPCNTDQYIVAEALAAWQLDYPIEHIKFQSCW